MRHLLALLAVLVLLPTTASAVPRPNGIQWTASPATFVRSLYISVLGRNAESSAAVNGWAAQINGNPTSRLSVFKGFVNSPEYRSRNRNGVRGRHFLWTNLCPKSPYNRYSVAKHKPQGSWTTSGSGVSFGYAMALLRYKMAFVPYRPCR